MKFKQNDFYLINNVTRPRKEVGTVGQRNNPLLIQLIYVLEIER